MVTQEYIKNKPGLGRENVAYRNVELPGLFRYEHKVFNFETRSAAGANHLSAFNWWT